jgi:ABC-2 type transport system ATP-binding protein
LSLERQIQVEILNLTPELLAKIRQIPGLASITEELDGLSLKIRETELNIEDLNEKLHALGARIRRFQPEIMDMEKVFMKLTQGKVQ